MSSFELKGKVAPCTLFRPLTMDLAVLGNDLLRRLAETPQFLRDLAVIMDFSSLARMEGGMNVEELAGLLRGYGLTPVGIQGGSEQHAAQARALHLGVFSENKGAAPASCCAGPSSEVGAMVVDRPVRSGQQVYARNRDLVVLAPVGPGAEVIADGSIHIYAPLRGRALAGALGFEGARIYCTESRAELLSVAGLYRVSEDLPESFRGAAVQVRLNGRQLVIESL